MAPNAEEDARPALKLLSQQDSKGPSAQEAGEQRARILRDGLWGHHRGLQVDPGLDSILSGGCRDWTSVTGRV